MSHRLQYYAEPTSQTVAAGSRKTYTINTAVLLGAAQTVALSVSGLPAGATDTSLSLSLNITHTFIGDLVVTLISPGGTSFVVFNRATATRSAAARAGFGSR